MNVKRLLIIDRCLRDAYRSWSLDDLIEACSETGNNSRRSVQADLELMRKSYSAPIVVVDKKYYRYSDENYTFVDMRLTDADKNSLQSALETIHDYCCFGEMKGVDALLYDLHEKIASSLGLSKPEYQVTEDTASKAMTIRLWIDSSMADAVRRHPIHSSQQIEFEEIDGSLNMVINMLPTADFINYLLRQSKHIKVTSPASLVNRIKRLSAGE